MFPVRSYPELEPSNLLRAPHPCKQGTESPSNATSEQQISDLKDQVAKLQEQLQHARASAPSAPAAHAAHATAGPSSSCPVASTDTPNAMHATHGAEGGGLEALQLRCIIEAKDREIQSLRSLLSVSACMIMGNGAS